MFIANKNKFRRKFNLLRTGLGSLCLFGSLISSVAQFEISNSTYKKIQDDNYSTKPGFVNSIVDSKKIVKSGDNEIRFHQPFSYFDNSNERYLDALDSDDIANIPKEDIPYLRLFFFGNDQTRSNLDCKITNQMLDYITSFDYLDIDIGNNLNYLSLFNNLKKVTFNFKSLDMIDNLPYNKNVEEVEIFSSNFSDEKCLYLSKKFIIELMNAFPNIKKFNFLGDIIFEPGSLEFLSNYNVETINFKLEEKKYINIDIDFTKLCFLKNIKFDCKRPYDLAMSLNSDEYYSLVSNGTNVEFYDKTVKEKYLNICKKIDNIIDKLQIKDNMTLNEKIDKIIVYILENYTYDEEVSYLIRNDIDPGYDLLNSFYEEGYLYGSLNSNTQICGNYSAMMEVLLDRVAAPDCSYFLASEKHAWNLIKEDGKLFYYDITWIDNHDEYNKKIILDSKLYDNHDLIVDGYGKSAPQYISWYKENIELKGKSEYSLECHKPNYVPKYMDIDNYFNFDIYSDESYIKIPDELIEKYNHLLSREEVLNLYESSKEKQDMYTIFAIALVVSAFLIEPKRMLDKKENSKIKEKVK